MKLVKLSISQWLPCPLAFRFGLADNSVKGCHNTDVLGSENHCHSMEYVLFIYFKSGQRLLWAL